MAKKNPVWAFQRAVLASRSLTSTEKLVALAMAHTANFHDGRKARPGPAHLRTLTGLSVRSITRARAELERQGWIVRDVSGGIVNGRRLTNEYHLNCGHSDRSQDDMGSESQPTRDTESTDSGHSDLPPTFDQRLTNGAAAPEVVQSSLEKARAGLRLVAGEAS